MKVVAEVPFTVKVPPVGDPPLKVMVGEPVHTAEKAERVTLGLALTVATTMSL